MKNLTQILGKYVLAKAIPGSALFDLLKRATRDITPATTPREKFTWCGAYGMVMLAEYYRIDKYLTVFNNILDNF